LEENIKHGNKKKWILSAALILAVNWGFANDTGLFLGQYGFTSVSTKNPIQVGADPEISVDFSVWFPEKTGALWSVKTNGKNELKLSYEHDRDTGGTAFILAFNASEEAARFSADPSKLNRFSPMRFSMRFPDESHEMFFSLAGDTIAFLANRTDVRQVEFETAHHNTIWSLNHVSVESGPRGNRETQLWDFASNQQADSMDEFIIKPDPEARNGILTFPLIEDKEFEIVYNSTDVLVFTKSVINMLSYDEKALRHIMNGPVRRIFNGHVIWNSKEEKVYTYYGGGSPLYEITANEPYREEEFEDHFHGQLKMVDQRNGDIYMVGGYGYHTFKNAIRKYDWDSRKWIAQEIKGKDVFEPRILLDLFQKDSNFVFFFGGHGNPTGKQELGRVFYNDLLLYDLDLQSITEISENLLPGKKDDDGANGVYSSKENCIYMFHQKDANDEKEFYLTHVWRISLEDIVTAERLMSFQSGIIVAQSPRYNEANNLIMYIEKKIDQFGKSFIVSRAVLLPIKGSLSKAEADSARWIILAVIAVLLAVGFFAFRKSSETKSEPVPPAIPEKGVAIHLNDPFKLFIDGSELDLSKESRHKQITELLLVLACAPDHRLSHEAIKEAVWPLVVDDSFVNSLNVTLTAVRRVLDPYGSEIIHQAKTVAFGKNITVIEK
jgi:hypothetical protein